MAMSGAGFGDLAPATNVVWLVASFEALSGHFLLALLVTLMVDT